MELKIFLSSLSLLILSSASIRMGMFKEEQLTFLMIWMFFLMESSLISLGLHLFKNKKPILKALSIFLFILATLFPFGLLLGTIGLSV